MRTFVAVRSVFIALSHASGMPSSRAASPFALPGSLNGLTNAASVSILHCRFTCWFQSLKWLQRGVPANVLC
jgi:hypothetical protein